MIVLDSTLFVFVIVIPVAMLLAEMMLSWFVHVMLVDTPLLLHIEHLDHLDQKLYKYPKTSLKLDLDFDLNYLHTALLKSCQADGHRDEGWLVVNSSPHKTQCTTN